MGTIAQIDIPDSRLCKEITELVRDTESELLFNHSSRVYCFGIAFEEFKDAERRAVVAAYPRTPRFKEDIIQSFYEGMKDRPDTTFGTVNADVLADKTPTSSAPISAA